MQRERIEHRRGRVELEDNHAADESECQALVQEADNSLSHENGSEQSSEDVIVCVVDPEGKDKARTGTPKTAKRSNGGNVLFLNGLRGLAALMVVQQHLQYTPEIRLGSCSVDVFFVLSAFLLTMLFERKCRQLLTHSASLVQWTLMLVDYFCKRFFRVYPLMVVVALALEHVPKKDLGRIYSIYRPYHAYDVLTFKFESRFFVFWSLPIEIAYYFLIPVFVAVIIALRRRWWLLALPLYVWVIHEGIHKHRDHHMPLRPHLTTFVAGSLAAVVYSKADQWIKTNAFEFSRWHRLAVRVVELGVFCLFMSIAFRGLLFHWVVANPYGKIEGFPFVSVPISALIVIEMLLPSALARFLEWNFLRYAGKISFSIYLLHPFVIHSLISRHTPDKYDRFFLNFGGTMLLATATYWVIEYPSQLAAQRVSKLLARVGTQASVAVSLAPPQG